MSVSRYGDEESVFIATLYAEARGEPDEGIQWVAWVIKNRSRIRNLSIKDVCLERDQFECWSGKNSIEISETGAFEKCKRKGLQVLESNYDPTGGCDHYNNANIETKLDSRFNVAHVQTISNHTFYRSL